MESEGLAKKCRVVIEGGDSKDEPVGQRWAGSSLQYEGSIVEPLPPMSSKPSMSNRRECAMLPTSEATIWKIKARISG